MKPNAFPAGYGDREARLLFVGVFGPGTEQNETFQFDDVVDGKKQSPEVQKKEKPDVRDQNILASLIKGPEQTDAEKLRMEQKEKQEEDPDVLAKKNAATIEQHATEKLAAMETRMKQKEADQDRAERDEAAKRDRLSTDDSITEIAGVAATGAMAFGTEENFDTKENTNIEQSATTKIASTEVEKSERPTAAETSEQVKTESLAQDAQGDAGDEAKKTESKQIFAEDAKQESKPEQFFT